MSSTVVGRLVGEVEVVDAAQIVALVLAVLGSVGRSLHGVGAGHHASGAPLLRHALPSVALPQSRWWPRLLRLRLCLPTPRCSQPRPSFSTRLDRKSDPTPRCYTPLPRLYK